MEWCPRCQEYKEEREEQEERLTSEIWYVRTIHKCPECRLPLFKAEWLKKGT